MKLSINKNTLESAVILCNAYVEKRLKHHYFSSFFHADEDKLLIKASDYEIGINYKIKKSA